MNFLYSHWLQLSLPRRIEIAGLFGIIKKNSTHVVDNQVKDDGYLIKDVEEAINIDALQKYLNTSETDFMILWNLLNDKLDGRNIQVLEIPLSENTVTTPIPLEMSSVTDTISTKPKRGRPKKQ